MPPRWQPAALAALQKAGSPWLALVRLVRRESQVGEGSWWVDLVESRRALPRPSQRRRMAHFLHARFAIPTPDLAPGVLLAIGGASSFSELLWIEVASPVASRAEARAFLDDCERALDAFVPEPIVSIDPSLAATFHRHPPGDRWAGVLYPLPAPEGDPRAHFAGDDPEHLSQERERADSMLPLIEAA